MRKVQSFLQERFSVLSRKRNPDEYDQLHREFIFTAKTVILWIYSCRQDDQLILCMEVIKTHLEDRYQVQILPADFEKGMGIVKKAWEFKKKSLNKLKYHGFS